MSVEEPEVVLDAYQSMELVGPYMVWNDGSPVYTPTGAYLPSPRQRVSLHGDPSPTFFPWTPLEFTEVSITGEPLRDRPSHRTCSGVLDGGRGGIDLFRQCQKQRDALLALGVTFSHEQEHHLDEINALLTGYTALVQGDPRKVTFALHRQDGVVGGRDAEQGDE